MKMYIPKLGDQIKLSQPWSFNLHHEGRNESLGKVLGVFGPFGEEQNITKWVKYETPIEFTDNYLDFLGKNRKHTYTKTGENQVVGREKSQQWKDFISPSYGGRYNPSGFSKVVLPEGSELIIDRIFIRQGSESFDSVTFYVSTIPGVENAKRKKGPFGKKPSIARFWAKLDDVNQMHFETIE